MKIRPVGAQLFLADGQTDMKIMIALHSIANAPKMGPIISELNKINHCNAFCYNDISTGKMQSVIQQAGCRAAQQNNMQTK